MQTTTRHSAPSPGYMNSAAQSHHSRPRGVLVLAAIFVVVVVTIVGLFPAMSTTLPESNARHPSSPSSFSSSSSSGPSSSANSKPTVPPPALQYDPCLRIIVGIVVARSRDVAAEAEYRKWLPLFDASARPEKHAAALECGLNFVFVYDASSSVVASGGRVVLHGVKQGTPLGVAWFSEAAHLFPDAHYIFRMDPNIAMCPPVLLREVSAAAAAAAHYVGFPKRQTTSSMSFTIMLGGFYGLRRDVAVAVRGRGAPEKVFAEEEEMFVGKIVADHVGAGARARGKKTHNVILHSFGCVDQSSCFLQQNNDDIKMSARTGPRCSDTAEYGDQRYTVEVRMLGRVGNQLFEWAGALGIAQQVGMQGTACIRSSADDDPYPSEFAIRGMQRNFAGPFNFPCKRDAASIGRNATAAQLLAAEVDEDGYGIADPKLIAAPLRLPFMRLKPRSHLQSWKYFHPHLSAKVRDMFRLKDGRVAAVADQRIRGIVVAAKAGGGNEEEDKKQQERRKMTVVGIHVRRGDHVREVNYLRFPPPRYFAAAMKHFENVAGGKHKVVFVVASDEIDWCKKQSFLKPLHDDVNNVVFVDDKKVILSEATGEELSMKERWLFDFAVMMKCDHLVMTLGTFGWWAGYLTGGQVTYYKEMFDLQHRENKGKVRLEDHFLSEWIGLG